jgi:hypothetical protein
MMGIFAEHDTVQITQAGVRLVGVGMLVCIVGGSILCSWALEQRDKANYRADRWRQIAKDLAAEGATWDSLAIVKSKLLHPSNGDWVERGDVVEFGWVAPEWFEDGVEG